MTTVRVCPNVTCCSFVRTGVGGLTALLYSGHSRVSSATGAVFDLNEGDMLYLPGGWAHEVESTGTSVAVTLWSDFQRGSN